MNIFPICHILCRGRSILYGLINMIRVLYGYLFILFYAGSNYGCGSIWAHSCSNQGWSDWHEEPDAGINMFFHYVLKKVFLCSVYLDQMHGFLIQKLAIFLGKCYSWPSCDIRCWFGFILANLGEDYWGSQRSYLLV